MKPILFYKKKEDVLKKNVMNHRRNHRRRGLSRVLPAVLAVILILLSAGSSIPAGQTAVFAKSRGRAGFTEIHRNLTASSGTDHTQVPKTEAAAAEGSSPSGREKTGNLPSSGNGKEREDTDNREKTETAAGKEDGTPSSSSSEQGGENTGEADTGEEKTGGDHPGGGESDGKEPADTDNSSEDGKDQETGDKETGDQEAGEKEAGGNGSGDQETGEKEAGGNGSGDQETGETGSGGQGSGENASGEQEAGKDESAGQEAGKDESGDQKAGKDESGDQEAGKDKSGDQVTGKDGSGEKESRENGSGKEASGGKSGDGEDREDKEGESGQDKTAGSGEDGKKDPSGDPGSGEAGSKQDEGTDRAVTGDKGNSGDQDKTGKEAVPENSGQAGTDPAAGKNAQTPAPEGNAGAAEGSTLQSPAAVEAAEEWMTASEFRRAYSSVSLGAGALGASTLSGAKIVSKESEIDYEDLGIGAEGNGHINHTTPINVRDQQGNDYTGICVVPDDRGWPKGTVLPDVRRVTDAVMIKLYYYTMLDSYGEDLARSKGFGNTRKTAVAACHEAMSMRYAELAGIEYDRPNLSSGFRSLVSAYRSGVSSKPVPDQDRVFVYISGRTQSSGHWMQAYVFGRMEEEEEEKPSSITLIKTTSDPDMRNSYSEYYCLHETASGGTVDFRMYEDKACTKRVHVYTGPTMTVEIDPIQVGHNGKSGLWNQSIFYCAPGTYYLKEVNTPKGYQTRTEPFGPFTLAEGRGITIKAENTPRYAQAGILKKDAKSGKVLAGAKFGFYSDLEDARNEADPEGVFTTGSDGRSNLIDVLAGKTYYVRELSAPEGYKPISGVKALTVAGSVTQTVWTEITNTADEPETGKVQVRKKPADSGATGSPYSLAGAEYTLYDKDGKNAGTLKTGENGISNVLTVPCGNYTLKETFPSPGFDLDTKTYNVTVRADEINLLESSEPPKKGTVQVNKKSSDPKATESPYSLAGAVYTLYDKDGKSAGTLKTGEDGTSNVLTVLCGSYTLAETSPSPGFQVEAKVHNVTVKADKLTVVESSETPEKGTVQVKKSTEDPGAVGDLYSLAGAEYTLYDKNGESVGTLRTGKDGTSNVLTVLCGSYTLKETSAPSGFELDTKTHNVTVRPVLNSVVESSERPKKGKITVRKVSSEEKEKKETDTMPVAGAVYSLYTTEEDAREGTGETGTFVIREDGSSDTLEVLAGRTYYIRETKTPEGYLPDEKIYRAEVTSFTETVTIESEDRLIFGGVKVSKLDRETGKGAPLGGGSLSGAVFKIWNDGDRSVYADGKKILPDGLAMTLTTDETGTVQTGARALSYGNYRIEEASAPEGYMLSEGEALRFAIREDNTLVDLTGSEDTSIKDQVIRGDFSLRKINGYTQKRMAGVTFEVTAFDREGNQLESHRFTTDANGNYESTAEWFNAQKKEEETGRLWFGIDTEPDDSMGALPYGDYLITEIEGENNRGMKMFSDHFSIYGQKQTVLLGNIENTMKPVLETELTDEDGDHFADSSGIVTLTDTVTYGGMEEYIGKEVVFHGVIHVRETGEPLLIDGKKVEDVRTKKIMSPSATVTLRFTFDASKTEGMTLVCYEYASEKSHQEAAGQEDPSSGSTAQTASPEPPAPWHDSTNGGEDIASHADPEDEAQTVRLCSIETEAEDALTGMHVGNAREGAVTVDHVTCRGLIPGRTYTVTGHLVNKANGLPLKDKEGKRVTAQAQFQAEEAEQTVDLTFTYDASLLENTIVVAFEQLYLKGEDSPEDPDLPKDPERPIAVHEDPEDEDQSIHYPEIRTSAAAADGDSKYIEAKGRITVRDRVLWENLITGQEYRLKGSLMRKDTGEPFMTAGKAVASEAVFTAEESAGETIIDFTFEPCPRRF